MPSAQKQPRILVLLPQFIPSTILTVVKPLTALHRAGLIVADITLEAWASPRQVERADVIIFSRNNEPTYGHTLERALALRKPIIYDIDDNFFELPSFYLEEAPQQSSLRLAQLGRYLETATLVRVYAEPMRERVQQLNSRVVQVDGLIDWNLIPKTFPPRGPHQVRIIYATSRIIQDPLASLFLKDIHRILSTYQERVEFFCWGYHPPELRGHPSVHFLNFVRDYNRFFRKFARSRFDIGLAPLRDEVFYRSKSNNKFREYAACRIAGVYSDVPVYSTCVTSEQTGLLISNQPGSWFHALSRLVEDRALREKIQEQAFAYARERYSLEKVQGLWLDQIFQVLVSAQQTSAGADQWHSTQGCHRKIPSSLPIPMTRQALLRLPVRFALRGIRLVRRVKAQGIGVTRRQVQWFLRDLYNIWCVKWNLWNTFARGG